MATQTTPPSDQAVTKIVAGDAVATKGATKKAATKKAATKKAATKKAATKKAATKKAATKKAVVKKVGGKTNGSTAPVAKKASKQASKNGSNGVGSSHRSSHAGKTEVSERMAQLLRKAESGISTAGRVAQQSATYAGAQLSDISAKVKNKTISATKKAEGWAKDHPVLASSAATAVATVAGALVMKKFKPKVAAGARAGAGLLLNKLRGK